MRSSSFKCFASLVLQDVLPVSSFFCSFLLLLSPHACSHHTSGVLRFMSVCFFCVYGLCLRHLALASAAGIGMPMCSRTPCNVMIFFGVRFGLSLEFISFEEVSTHCFVVLWSILPLEVCVHGTGGVRLFCFCSQSHLLCCWRVGVLPLPSFFCDLS